MSTQSLQQSSVTIQLDQETFEMQRLEPFGVKLRGPSGKKIYIQEWVAENVEQVGKLAAENGVVVVENTFGSNTDEWDSIRPRASGDFQFPHSDFRGEVELVYWLFKGNQRNPTSFVPVGPAIEMMQKFREILKVAPPEEFDGMYFIKELDQLYHNLGQPAAEVDPNATCTFHRSLKRDKGLEDASKGLDRAGKSFVDRAYDFINRKKIKERRKEDSRQSRARDYCLDILNSFHEALMQRLAPLSYVHKWTEHTNESLIVYNGSDEHCVLHSAALTEERVASAQSDILRSSI